VQRLGQARNLVGHGLDVARAKEPVHEGGKVPDSPDRARPQGPIRHAVRGDRTSEVHPANALVAPLELGQYADLNVVLREEDDDREREVVSPHRLT
jgi:hypothetical protein